MKKVDDYEEVVKDVQIEVCLCICVCVCIYIYMFLNFYTLFIFSWKYSNVFNYAILERNFLNPCNELDYD